MNILICGGAGFIGSHFVKKCFENKHFKTIHIIDKLTYAGDVSRIIKYIENGDGDRIKFSVSDIWNGIALEHIFEENKFDYVINFAAETHVDNSIKDSSPFMDTNIIGVKNLCDSCLKYNIKKFYQISTDEVYGSTTMPFVKFRTTSELLPNNPYSASKAAADLIIRSYQNTYNLNATIIRPCNNYGPMQNKEKFIPKTITNLLQGIKTPIYGEGLQIREWIYVEDCVNEIYDIVVNNKYGIFNIASGKTFKNIEMAKIICSLLNCDESLLEFVKDRPGHDFCYTMQPSNDTSKLTSIYSGLEKTIEFYKKNLDRFKN